MQIFKPKSDGCDAIRLVQLDKYCRIDAKKTDPLQYSWMVSNRVMLQMQVLMLYLTF